MWMIFFVQTMVLFCWNELMGSNWC